jgi:hypothetical protein
MQSTEMTIGLSDEDWIDGVPLSIQALRDKVRGLRRILVNHDVLGDRDNLTGVIVTARRADVMRALQLTAIAAVGWVASDQSIMCTAHVTLRTGDSVLWDSHVSISICWGHAPDFVMISGFQKAV